MEPQIPELVQQEGIPQKFYSLKYVHNLVLPLLNSKISKDANPLESFLEPSGFVFFCFSNMKLKAQTYYLA